MTKVNTGSGYDYYIGYDSHNVPFYNIVPNGKKPPKGGYYSKGYILQVKKVPDLF